MFLSIKVQIQEQLGHRVRQTTEKYKGQIGFRKLGKVREICIKKMKYGV